jgi:hypothetical protein
MGMFDTFYLQDTSRTIEVQSREFACFLDDYRLGDFVSFEGAAPIGVTAYIEEHKINWQDSNCPVEWIVLLIVDSCFMDGFVASSKSEAQHAADIMVKLWASPERQAEAFKRFAKAHFAKRTEFDRGLANALRLVCDYDDWSTKGAEKNNLFRFLRHDFDKESWDLGLARMLSSIPEFAEHLPGHYLARLKAEAEQDEQQAGDESPQAK